MMDSANPLEGWPAKEVLSTCVGPAQNDSYGRLYYYIRDLISMLHRSLSNCTCKLQLFNLDAIELPDVLAGLTFDRIEVWKIPLDVDGTFLD